MRILVLGGAGYIGSHTALELVRAGEDVIVADNLVTGHREAIPRLRKTCSDRAILRAAHFFAESERATAEAKALEDGDLSAFFALVRESGTSSAELLQNLFSCQKPTEQAIPLGIWYSKQFLGEKGAVRVHGGGFAGTIQAFVKNEAVAEYKAALDGVFGEGACSVLMIRKYGGMQVL